MVGFSTTAKFAPVNVRSSFLCWKIFRRLTTFNKTSFEKVKNMNMAVG
jgi:hypothetical protein